MPSASVRNTGDGFGAWLVAGCAGSTDFTAPARAFRSAAIFSPMYTRQSMKSAYVRMVPKRGGSTSSQLENVRYHARLRCSRLPCLARSHSRNRAMLCGQ